MTHPESWPPGLGAVPLVFGDDDLVEGYYELERAERNQGMQTLAKYAEETSSWYRALTLHRRAFLRGFAFSCSPEELRSHQLRMQLLGLGLSSSKAALDQLLVGYYSVAFATIRHMVESWLFCRYVEAFPDQAAAFYLPEPGAPSPPPRPKAKTIAAKLKKRSTDQRDRDLYDTLYGVWEAMSVGSHPSGAGIRQTVAEQEGRGVIGATLQAELANAGFVNGLPAAMYLVHETGRLQPQGQEWEAGFFELSVRILRFRGIVMPRT